MTKEELKQEADKYFKSICGDYNEEYERTGKRHYWVGFDIKNAYLAGAEPREKQIAELEAEVTRLKNENLDIINKYTRFAETDRRTIAELEAQIEKMKCWCNCKNYLSCLEECCRKNISFEKGICYNCKKWELRR